MSKYGVRQHDESDCGAACLASVAAYYRYRLPISRIRQYASTSKQGTNIAGLQEAAIHMGFEAKGAKGKPESLSEIPLPAIAHVRLPGDLYHYVVIFRVTKTRVIIMDPADGRIHRIPWTEFLDQWTGILLLMVPSADFSAGDERISVIRRFGQLMRTHRSAMLEALFGALIYTVLGLAFPIFLQKVIDTVIPNGNLKLLNLMGMVLLALIGFRFFINHFKTMLTLRTGQLLDASLILGYYRHLLQLPQRFFDTMRTGEILSRIGDATKIRSFINEVLLSLGVDLFILVFSFVLMFTYYWKLALVMLIIVPLYAALYIVSNRLNRRTQRQLMERGAELEAQLVESIDHVATIKQFGMENWVHEHTSSKFVRLLGSVFSSAKNTLWIGNTGELISSLQVLSLLWGGVYFVVEGVITPGELLSFYAIIGYFSGPVMSLITMNRVMQDALIAADRLFEVFDLDSEEADVHPRAIITPDQMGDIVFRQVKFAYGSGRLIFDGLDLRIKKGRMNAIVGESGSGKSTILSLLQRVYPIKEGTIHIGVHDIAYVDIRHLRQIVGAVPQQIHIFATTVLENITAGVQEVDLGRVQELCSLLGMEQFIDELPDRLYTKLSENGQNLSGGQRQRLAIARALYHDPELLILDEATAALDTISERHIQHALKNFIARGKTVIQIAHRLHSITEADEIFVMADGEVIEQGTHEALLGLDGHYAMLWR